MGPKQVSGHHSWRCTAAAPSASDVGLPRLSVAAAPPPAPPPRRSCRPRGENEQQDALEQWPKKSGVARQISFSRDPFLEHLWTHVSAIDGSSMVCRSRSEDPTQPSARTRARCLLTGVPSFNGTAVASSIPTHTRAHAVELSTQSWALWDPPASHGATPSAPSSDRPPGGRRTAWGA